MTDPAFPPSRYAHKGESISEYPGDRSPEVKNSVEANDHVNLKARNSVLSAGHWLSGWSDCACEVNKLFQLLVTFRRET